MRVYKTQHLNYWIAVDSPSAVNTYREFQHRINIALVDLQLPGLQVGIVLAELAQIKPEMVRCAMIAEISPYAASAYWAATVTTALGLLPGTTPCADRRLDPSR